MKSARPSTGELVEGWWHGFIGEASHHVGKLLAIRVQFARELRSATRSSPGHNRAQLACCAVASAIMIAVVGALISSTSTARGPDCNADLRDCRSLRSQPDLANLAMSESSNLSEAR